MDTLHTLLTLIFEYLQPFHSIIVGEKNLERDDFTLYLMENNLFRSLFCPWGSGFASDGYTPPTPPCLAEEMVYLMCERFIV